jgi:hypothetical protein
MGDCTAECFRIFQEGLGTTRSARELRERVLSDKYLTVKEWQKFAAERAFKESAATKAMVKALAAAEKAGNAPPSEQLQVLDALEAAGRDLLKLHKGDKKLESYLEDVYKPLKKYRKEAEKTQAKEEKAEAKAAKAEAKAGASADGDDDEEDGPAFLEPKRLFRQLSLCKADSALRVHFAYIDGPEKEPGSLGLSPKLSGVAMFKKLVLASGVKTGAYGTAWVEGTELMLQPDKALGGLARKLRAPVKACGFKVTRIVLCNPDGSVLEAEAEDEAAEGGAPAPAAAARATATPEPPDSSPEPASPAEPPAPAAAPSLEAQFIARLKALMPRMAQHAATREGQAAKLLASEAGLLARKADFAAALKNLDKIDLLLARLAGAPPSPPTAAAPATAAPAATPAAAAAPAAPRFDADAWRRARDQWRDASEAVDDQLNALRLAVVQGARTEPEYAEALAQIAGAGLNAITGRHRVQVAVALRELGDGAPSRVEAHGEKALAAVRAFRQFLRTSPQIAACDANPFEVDVQIRATLESALDALAEVLAGD